MKPVGNRIIVSPILEQTRESGIVLTGEALDQVGKDNRQGRVVSSNIDEVQKDDVVLYSRFHGTPFEKDGQDYVVLDFKEVMGVVQ